MGVPRTIVFACVTIAALLTAMPAAAAVQDLAVLDSGRLSVLRVDEQTGAQAVVSNGGLLVAPTAIAALASGDVVVTDRGVDGGPGSIIHIETSTGQQSVLASAGLLKDPTGVALAPDGALLVADEAAANSGALIRVDVATGGQSTVASGGLLVDPAAVAVGPDGAAYLVDPKAFDKAGGIIRVDLATGAQMQLTSGGNFRRPRAGLFVGDRLLVADKHTPQPKGVLIAVGSDGAQSLFTAGNLLDDPSGLLALGGDVLVADASAYGGNGGITRVSQTTAAQSRLASDGLFMDPVSLALATFDDAAPALPAPVLGKTVNVEPVGGIVRVARLRGGRRGPFKRIRGAMQIRVGSAIDVSRGRVRLTSATLTGVQFADFHGGGFVVRQRRADGGLTELRLLGKPHCGAGAGASARRPRSRLWGDGKGRFRTRGRRSAATVRGTRWLVEERCRGTFTRVARGVVAVRDVRRKKAIVLRQGDDYLARRPAH